MPDTRHSESGDAPLNWRTPVSGWHAELDLRYERRAAQTVLAERNHFGPLRVQKALYPEGESICHTLLLHPPAGIAGGDHLEIRAVLGENAHALLTTPGAAKCYRSGGPWAFQQFRLDVDRGAVLEWLPQETIVFDGAKAGLRTNVSLAGDAVFIGWEVLCLGRRASGERFDSGSLSLSTRIERNGFPVWVERGLLDGGSSVLHSAAGLAGFSVSATLLVAAKGLDSDLLAACREIAPREIGAMHGLTLFPDLLVGRCLGHSSEAVTAWLEALWQLLRPAVVGREAVRPRIWNT